MNKNKLSILAAFLLAIIIGVFSCAKQSSPVVSTDYSFSEEFDTVSKSVAKGWVITNNTKPIGTIPWMQGFYYISQTHKSDGFGGALHYPSAGGFGGNSPADSPAFSGSDFILTTSECGHDTANCSNWLISPPVIIKNGVQVSFYTRTYDNPSIAADRLEVRINTQSSNADVGRDSNSTGGFTQVILDINPDYLLSGDGSYPGKWTKYTATISGLTAARKSRVAFRYYVPNGGPLGINGLGIGIDKFQFISN